MVNYLFNCNCRCWDTMRVCKLEHVIFMDQSGFYRTDVILGVKHADCVGGITESFTGLLLQLLGLSFYFWLLPWLLLSQGAALLFILYLSGIVMSFTCRSEMLLDKCHLESGFILSLKLWVDFMLLSDFGVCSCLTGL